MQKESRKEYPYLHIDVNYIRKVDIMLAIGIIFFAILACLTGCTALYFFHEHAYNPKIACVCSAFCILCICITSHLNQTLKIQMQPVYHRIFEDELVRTDTLCYKDGSLFDTHFFGETELVTQNTSNGFYKFHITRATPEGPRKITPEFCCDSETTVNIKKDCYQPTVEEFIHHEYLISPDGEICYEYTEPKFILTIPPNTLKSVDSFQGS